MSKPLPSSPIAFGGNGRAMIFMVAAMACFVCNDTVMKHLGSELPIAQLTMLRSIMVTLLLLAFVRPPRSSPAAMPSSNWRLLGDRWVAVRAGCDAIGTLLYLSALVQLPIANATAIGMSLPLMLAVMAALFLRERVGIARSTVAGLGFVGVLMVVQPRVDGFGGAALTCLIGVMFHASRDLITRRLPNDVPVRLISISSALAIGLAGSVLCLFQGWRDMSGWHLALLLLASAFMSGAYQLIITALRTGELSVIAPLRYVTLLFAVFVGYAIWGDVPNGWAWAGIGTIVASGFIMLRIQRPATVAATD